MEKYTLATVYNRGYEWTTWMIGHFRASRQERK